MDASAPFGQHSRRPASIAVRLSMSEEKKIPEGRLGRFVRLAGLGARTGASVLFSKDGAGAAEQAAEVLGTLRGLAAKVGQMASYIDGIVPEEHRSAYETSLRVLRAAAP